MNVMTQFHSKAQRKMVMRLVKQNQMNERFIKKYESSPKLNGMTNDAKMEYIDKHQPYPKLTEQVLNLAKTNEDNYDTFMQKAHFKGDKGKVIPKLYHSSTDANGQKWYQTSMLETKKHLVKGKGDFHYVEKFHTPFMHTKKSKRQIRDKLYNSN